jgi:hypothetical protein
MVPSIFSRRESQTPSTRSEVHEPTRALSSSHGFELTEEAGLPPVVARMVVEIRSDGSKTVARGALIDLVTGERVALQANAATPIALAKELSKMILKTPMLATEMARQAALGLLPSSLKSRLHRGKK